MKTMYKKRLQLITGLIISLAVFGTAQVNVDEAVDFTLTDVKGTTHHLFDYLDKGKYVVINLTLMG